MTRVSRVTPLRQFREGLQPKVSQESMARKSHVVLQTYRNAENGLNVSYTTATAILKAINDERASRRLDALELDQLGLNIV
jgi:DNA-binding XRE family transcriptional regulator